MRRVSELVFGLILLIAPMGAQSKRLWVLQPTGEMIEYNPATFAKEQTVKVPAEAAKSSVVEVNHAGQILFSPPVPIRSS